MHDDEYYALLSSLRQKQYRYHIDLTHRLKTKNNQLLHFISGGAGIGKNLLIRILT